MKAYVYQIIVDGVARYIGKGTGRRITDHMKLVRMIARRRASGETVRTTRFYNRLTKAWLSGAEIEFIKIAEDISDAEAFDHEVVEIAVRSGLWNTTPGGEGYSADQWNDPAFRELMRSREESKRTPEYRSKRSAIAQSLWNDPSHRAKMIAAIWTPERRAKAEAQRKLREAAIKSRWYPFVSWNEKQKAEAAERRRLKALEPKKAIINQVYFGTINSDPIALLA